MKISLIMERVLSEIRIKEFVGTICKAAAFEDSSI